MRKNRFLLTLMAVVFLAQWAVPAAMIARREIALRRGEVFLFRTAPIDPYDPFRGRYVTLNFRSTGVSPENAPEGLETGRRVYATVSRDDDGFAVFQKLSLTPPAHDSYLRTRVRRITPSQITIDIPFDRFYMEETAAPEAERAWLRHAGRGELESWARVRLYAGTAVTEDLVIGGTPVLEFIEKEKSE